MKDLVSVIMPSYNTAKYIKESVESVIRQTYTNWELLIVDDCSTDNTDEVISPFLADKRIRYLKNPVNSGAAVSRNRALREAKGRWIAFLDSDDLWYPQKLEKQIEFMEKHNYSFSYTEYTEIDKDSRPNGRRVSGPKRITQTGMYNYCWPGCLTVMYDAERIGLVQIEDIKKNNDYSMWLKICRKADCCLLDEVLAAYRSGRDGSISSQGYLELIAWHFRLFKEAEQTSFLMSLVYTARNLFWGIYKKIRYVKR